MSYYQGDYYQGDPGLFGAIGSVLKGAVKVGSSFIPGPVGGIVRAGVGTIFNRPAPAPKRQSLSSMAISPPQISPKMEPFRQPLDAAERARLGLAKRRRRMNVTNDKALRRAVRRTDGFVKLAKRALRGTGYTVVSKSSRARRVNVRESGAGGVTVH